MSVQRMKVLLPVVETRRGTSESISAFSQKGLRMFIHLEDREGVASLDRRTNTMKSINLVNLQGCLRNYNLVIVVVLKLPPGSESSGGFEKIHIPVSHLQSCWHRRSGWAENLHLS